MRNDQDMTTKDPQRLRFEEGSFLALVLLVSLAFIILIEPYFGAILWSLVAAILFAPTYRYVLATMPGRPNTAAALTLLTIVAVFILPALALGMALIEQGTSLYGLIAAGQIDFADLFQKAHASLPDWAHRLLARIGLGNFAAANEMLANSIIQRFQLLLTRMLAIGQGAFKLIVSLGVMLYLTFFLLRDGERIATQVTDAIPLDPVRRDALIHNFVVVVRATIKGSVVVGIVQGMLGGLIFWMLGIPGPLLWGVLMGVFSFFPAVGTGIVWVPVAIYLLVVGQTWQGLFLIFCGLFVIGLIDNLLRPMLVGKDARIPDYMVLISTLGGLNLFGISGFIVGPLLAALFLATWNILTEARKQWMAKEPPAEEP
jgi:predicted PurR-regulated permease PerM